MIDSHTHLTACADSPDVLLARAREAGVGAVVAIGSSPEEIAAVAPLAAEHPDVWSTAGLHPHHAERWDDHVAAEVEHHAEDHRCVAIGETGLDWFRDRAPRGAQERAFRAQLAIARRVGKPVVVHCREADAECFAILREERPPGVVLHCFSTPDRLDEALDLGWWISFAGNVTYPSAGPLQEAARRCPRERLLLETDAPYLAPVPHRGRPNEPAHVMETLRYVAALRDEDPVGLGAAVSANAVRAFALGAP